jgi:hypothetical protein
METIMASLKNQASTGGEPSKGFFTRLFESIAESRMRQVQHEIHPYGVELERLKREHEESDSRAAASKRPH